MEENVDSIVKKWDEMHNLIERLVHNLEKKRTQCCNLWLFIIKYSPLWAKLNPDLKKFIYQIFQKRALIYYVKHKSLF
jgi:hypothetical protein